MAYALRIKRQAQKTLQNLAKAHRYRITEKIMILGRNPRDVTLDVKPLEGQAGYRLRIGSWRVIFDLDEEIKLISIEKIKTRGDVYK